MTTFTGKWSKDDVAQFLSEQDIPIRLSFISTDNQPWMLSLWYLFEDDVIYCATRKESKVIENLTRRPYCAFEVSTNDPPYRGVRGKGVVTITPDEDLLLLKKLVDRYISEENDTFREWLLGRDVQEVQIAIEPEKIYSWDYGDRMRGISE